VEGSAPDPHGRGPDDLRHEGARGGDYDCPSTLSKVAGDNNKGGLKSGLQGLKTAKFLLTKFTFNKRPPGLNETLTSR